MPSLTASNVTTANRVHLPLKLKLKQGWRYFKRKFGQHKLDIFKVAERDSLSVRLSKQSATVLCDGAYLVVNLVKLPAAVAITVYRAVTHTQAPSYPLGSEQRSLLQYLTNIGVYSVALPFDSAKGLMYLIEGAAKSLGHLGNSIGKLSQKATHHCCDHEAQVRTPHHLIQEITVPGAIELSLISDASVSVTQKPLGERNTSNPLLSSQG